MTSSPLGDPSLSFSYRPSGTLPASYFGANPFPGYQSDFTRCDEIRGYTYRIQLRYQCLVVVQRNRSQIHCLQVTILFKTPHLYSVLPCGIDPSRAAVHGIQLPMSQRRKRRVLFSQAQASLISLKRSKVSGIRTGAQIQTSKIPNCA